MREARSELLRSTRNYYKIADKFVAYAQSVSPKIQRANLDTYSKEELEFALDEVEEILSGEDLKETISHAQAYTYSDPNISSQFKERLGLAEVFKKVRMYYEDAQDDA